ncbi:hypothetical protein QUW15_01120 [Desulfovibrio piger]|nr:hypothetical protein [Desulfovibrio piger]
MGKGGGGKYSAPSVQSAPAPTVAATPPEPEETAEAPEMSETARNQESNSGRRRGASALRIDLNVGGVGGAGSYGNGGGGNGLSLPR